MIHVFSFFKTIYYLGSLSHERLDQIVFQGPFQGLFYNFMILQGSHLNLHCWYRSMANQLVYPLVSTAHMKLNFSSLKYWLPWASVNGWAVSNMVLVTFFFYILPPSRTEILVCSLMQGISLAALTSLVGVN